MKRRLQLLVVSIVLWGTPLSAKASSADESSPPSALEVTCVDHKTEARFVGLAFNHLVHLKNHCTYAVSCRISTDVNPKPETVVLSPGAEKTRLTFRGSPARIFKAEVSCRRSSSTDNAK